MSIRHRLLLLVFAVWAPSVVAFALLAYSTYLREAEGAKANVQQLGERLKLVVERELDKRAVLAKALAATRAVRDQDLEKFHEEATAATKDTGDWAIIVDHTTLLANTLLPSGQPSLRRESAAFATGAPAVFFYKQGPVLKRPVLSVLAPVGGTPSSLYNVGVGFEPAVIQSLVEQFAYPQGGVAAVLDKSQIVVARSREPQKWLGAQATGDVQKRAQAGKADFAESVTLDGVASLTYVTAADRYGWTIVIALPKSALTVAARDVTLRFVAASALLLVIALVMALYAAQRISVPILALRIAAVQLGSKTVPPKLSTGLSEADDVGEALHEAGLRARQAADMLEKRVIEAVQKAEQAQATLLVGQKHEAIGRLTGGLAHDFNNLLQTITTGLQILEHTAGEGPQRGVLEACRRASTKAAGLIRQMLTFGRSQSLQPRPVDLRDFILKNQELAGKAIGGRIQMKASIEAGLPSLFVDPTQLELATLNLVFNASQSMPDGGHICVVGRRARDEEVTSLGSGRFVCLEVSDNGVGMNPEVLAKAFEPYFTTKPVGSGSGVGLSQVLSFARQSGGDIRLESTPNEGTRACLILPATDIVATAPTCNQADSGSTQQKPLKVLMVEDDILVSSVVVPALQQSGHEVTLCPTADDALLLLSGNARFDILFTDIVMPGEMNGMDLLHWCRIHRPAMPAVVASGYTSEQTDDRAPVLPKPYNIETLLKAVQHRVHPAA